MDKGRSTEGRTQSPSAMESEREVATKVCGQGSRVSSGSPASSQVLRGGHVLQEGPRDKKLATGTQPVGCVNI